MTLVVDASVVAEVLLNTRRGGVAGRHLDDHHVVAPQHLVAEVVSVLRGWSLGGHLTDREGRLALRELDEMGIELLPVEGLLPQVWDLRHNLSAYDAMYVVLARAIDAPLLTLDERLVRAAPDCARLAN